MRVEQTSGFGRISPTLIGLFLILISAIYYLAELPNVRHGFDQSYQAYLALRMLDGGELITVGQPSSVFLDNPPLMAYIVALPLLVWRSVWSVYVLICLLNAGAVWFVYDVARTLIGPRVALVTGLLFATNPWIIHFGRMPWTQGLLPFFMAATAWGIWPTLVRKPCQPRRFLFGLLMAIAMMQTYILGIALAAPLVLLLLLNRKRVPLRPTLIASAVFVISFGLFAAQLASTPGTSGDKFSAFVAELNIEFEPIAIWHATRFVTGRDYWGADVAANTLIAAPPLAQLAHWTLNLLLALGLARALYDLRDPDRRPLALTLLIWFGIPTLGLAFVPFLIHPHYLMLTLPAGHLLAAYTLRPLLVQRQLRWAVALLVLMFVGQWRVNLWRSGQAVAANPIWPRMNGWALSEAAEFGRILQSPISNAPSPPRIIVPDHPSLASSMAGQLFQKLDDLSYPDFVIIPAEQPAQYVVIDQPVDSSVPLMQRVDGNAKAQVVATQTQDRTLAAGLPTYPITSSSDAGLSLLGISPSGTTEQSGSSLVIKNSTLSFSTYWYVDHLLPDRAEWYVGITYQLFDANGGMRLNTGPHGMWARDWQQNDLLIERVSLDLPDDLVSGEYTLLIILFDPIHNVGFNLLGSDRAPFITIPIQVE